MSALVLVLAGLAGCSEATGPAEEIRTPPKLKGVSFLFFGNPSDVPTGGVTESSSGDEGRSGGATTTYTNINLQLFTYLLWAPDSRKSTVLAFDGTADSPGEVLTYASTPTDESFGQLIWTGQAHLHSTGGVSIDQTLDTRATITVTDVSGNPISLLHAANYPNYNIPASAGAFEIVGGDFRTNAVFEVNNNGAWVPVKDYLDQISASNVQPLLAFSGAFYESLLGSSLSPSETSEDFGHVLVGSGVDGTTITLANNGTVPVPIAMTFTGTNASDFSVISSTCSTYLNTDQSCTITLHFAPSGSGARDATLNITGANTPVAIALSGAGDQGVPSATVTPTGLAFGVRNVGTSGTLQLTVKNTGTGSLEPSALPVTGANPSDFVVTVDGCSGTSVLPNATCSATVQFTPSAAGSRSAELTVVGNAPSVTVPLTGAGTALTAVASASVAGLTFPQLEIGRSSSAAFFQITNTGNADLVISALNMLGSNPLDFVGSAQCVGLNIPPGGACNVGVTFTPTAAGSRYATLSVVSNAAPVAIALSGYGLASAIQFNVSGMVFPATTVGLQSQSQPLQVINAGSANLVISSISVSGSSAADFVKTADFCTGSSVAPGSGCTVTLTFAPSAAGSRTASLAITSNAPGGAPPFALTGNGTAAVPAIQVAGAVNFNSVPVGTTFHSITRVSNPGTGALVISGISVTGPNASEFGATTCVNVSIAPGGACDIDVAFTPVDVGQRYATVTLMSNAGQASFTAAGSAYGQSVLSLGQSSLIFPSLPLRSTSAAQAISVRNVGNLALHLSGVSISGIAPQDFAVVSNNCPTAIAPGSACSIAVTFTPTAGGQRDATVSIQSDGGYGSVQLAGIGVPPADLAISMSADPTTAHAGKPLTYTISVVNSGPGTGTDISVTDVLPASSTFASVSAPAGVFCTAPAPGSVGTLICNAGSLTSGANFSITLTVNLLSGGKASMANTATVSASSQDLVSSNNSVTVATTVMGRR